MANTPGNRAASVPSARVVRWAIIQRTIASEVESRTVFMWRDYAGGSRTGALWWRENPRRRTAPYYTLSHGPRQIELGVRAAVFDARPRHGRPAAGLVRDGLVGWRGSTGAADPCVLRRQRRSVGRRSDERSRRVGGPSSVGIAALRHHRSVARRHHRHRDEPHRPASGSRLQADGPVGRPPRRRRCRGCLSGHVRAGLLRPIRLRNRTRTRISCGSIPVRTATCRCPTGLQNVSISTPTSKNCMQPRSAGTWITAGWS